MTALADIQRRVGVTPDGKWGPATLAAVAKALGMTGAPMDPFDAALREVLKHEGGYVNHPSDPGGRTNRGVTQRTWEAWTGKPASEADMRGLTVEDVRPLYRKRYWDEVRGSDLPAGLALCVFDFGVNAGPSRAVRFLQRLVGASQDGLMGPATLGAVNAHIALHGAPAAVRAYQNDRRAYYRSLSTFAKFGKGWLRRVDEVEARALEMVA